MTDRGEPGERASARLVVSVHDVAPVTAQDTAWWCADADALGIPVSLLVIPGPWDGTSLLGDPGYAEVLRERNASGDALVLHGWQHKAPSGGSPVRRAIAGIVARGAGEFAALEESQAAWRLAAGRAVLTSLGLVSTGFTPPGWLASPGTIRALRRAGFRYTTSHSGVLDLTTGRHHLGFALAHRPTGGPGQWVGSALVDWLPPWLARGGGLIRIALHPADLHRPGLRGVSLRAIERVLAAGCRAITYDTLIGPAPEPRRT